MSLHFGVIGGSFSFVSFISFIAPSFGSLKPFQVYSIVHLHHVTAQSFKRRDSLASGCSVVDVKSKIKKLFNSTLRVETFFRCLHLQLTISNKEGQESGACLTSFTNFPFFFSRAFTTTSNREKKEKNICRKKKNCVEKKVFRQQWNFLKLSL